MRSQKIRLKPTKDQESLMWWYSKVSRNYWNLLVDIDKRNNTGEFDEILSNNGNKIIVILLKSLLPTVMKKIVKHGIGIINQISLSFITF